MTLPRYVRAAPRIFYAIGVLDFVKNLLPVYFAYQQLLVSNLAYPEPLTPHIVSAIFAAVVYSAGWFAYGVFALILLSIHDRVTRPEAPAEPVQ